MKFKKPIHKLEIAKGRYFITFVTWERLELTPNARQVVLEACQFFHNQRYQIFTGVIMPDHVHLLIQPFLKTETAFWSIGSILHSIKSYSAKQIPKVMKHIGKVWQDGRYDKLMRDEKEFEQLWEYIRQNPVKAGLSKTPEDYPFFWEIF
ncbi:REP-associated tyrosine transposase [Coleofasciculus sp. E2-BRE-01]|uniref:REP-associated tyrosine transposase n=1 Tax=Coleofasciculus sp. E2-BRE-01 TaxID=3069524 RepID=UPI0032F29E9D